MDAGGGWRKLCKEEFRGLYFSPGTGFIAEEMQIACRSSTGKAEGMNILEDLDADGMIVLKLFLIVFAPISKSFRDMS